jgi:hypothetical protein
MVDIFLLFKLPITKHGFFTHKKHKKIILTVLHWLWNKIEFKMNFFLIFVIFYLFFAVNESQRTVPHRLDGRKTQNMRNYSRNGRIIGGSPADIADVSLKI